MDTYVWLRYRIFYALHPGFPPAFPLLPPLSLGRDQVRNRKAEAVVM